jgi:hypothetical protein
MKAIYALYPNPESAQRAVNSLRVAGPELGIAERDIVAFSSEPWDEYDLDGQAGRTVIPWLAALGGLLGAAGGYWLAFFTQRAYAIPTGGMPIVTPWTDAIIAYETTLLGAVLFTLLALLPGVRLPGRRVGIYDPQIAEGKILIGVTDPPANAGLQIEERLREAGSNEVTEFPPPV